MLAWANSALASKLVQSRHLLRAVPSVAAADPKARIITPQHLS